MCWLLHAKTASEVRRAAIRDDFAQARFLNAQNFRHRLMKSGGVLDQQVLQAALGKRQPRQRMWGLSGPAVLGVALMLHVSRLEEALALIQRLSSAVSVVRVAVRDEGHSPGLLSELQLWFRGPRQTGDFLVQWCTRIHALRGVKLCPLFPPDHYVAADPDDMLAIQEWHMASEGLDTESGCPRCRSGTIQPITVTAENEPCGNPGFRVVLSGIFAFAATRCTILSDSILFHHAHFLCRSFKPCVLRLLEHLPRSVSLSIKRPW